MNTDLPSVLERARQNRAARALEATRPSRVSDNRRPVGAGPFVAGDRVFDTVSGELAEVIHGARENVVVSTAQR